MFRLKTSVQEYEWGKSGSDSLVAQLAPESVGPDFKLDEQGTYAEIWMGTHANAPSYTYDDPSKTLQSLVESDPPKYLGTLLTRTKFPSAPPEVPYLFKILSIAKALPLQAHPDKRLAEELYKSDGEKKTFVDANHKPEIAVALSDGFHGFVGFRPFAAIKSFLTHVPELVAAIDDAPAVDTFLTHPTKIALRHIYTALLNQPQEKIAERVRELVAKVQGVGAAATASDGDVARVILKLQEQYPGDVGVLAAPFFMNLVTLDKGEAIYIGADEAHAYLEGDIIECMAVSDNVLNSAFVPPAERQTDIFTSMLTYTARPAGHWSLPHTTYAYSGRGRTEVYDPPLEEFVVLGTTLSREEGGATEVLAPVGGPTIGIVTDGEVKVSVDGEALSLKRGAVVYVLPQKEIRVDLADGSDEGVVWWSTCL